MKIPFFYRSTHPPHLEIFRFQRFLTSGLVTRKEKYSRFSHFPPDDNHVRQAFLWPYTPAVNPVFLHFSPHGVQISFLLLTRCHVESVRRLPAGLHALRRAMGGSQRPPDEQLNGAVGITLRDLQWAMSAVKPSAMREVAVDVPKVIAPLSIGFRVVPTSNGSFKGPVGPSSNPRDGFFQVPMEEMG